MNGCIVDCVIICNTGHIILLEIKSSPERKDFREAIAQLSDYKQLLKNCSFKTILSKLEDTPSLKQFICTNKISENLIAEQYNKINDYFNCFCINIIINY